jgi:hypothetical protein
MLDELHKLKYHFLQNWNYNSGAGKASKAITFWQYQTSSIQASIQCTNCFARFTATATIKWLISRDHWYSTSVTVKFMAHVVMSAQMNVDVGFSFNGAWSYSVPPVRLVRIQSMVGAALSSLSIFGVNLRIGLDYGLDIRQGSQLHFTDFMSPQSANTTNAVLVSTSTRKDN